MKRKPNSEISCHIALPSVISDLFYITLDIFTAIILTRTVSSLE